MDAEQELREELRALRERVARLEEAVGAARAAGPAPASVQLSETVPVAAVPMAAHQPSQAGPDRRRVTLESRIGSQVFNRVGIFAVLAAVAWFLKLAVDRNWIGPWPRVLVGLAAALSLVLWSERFRRGGYDTFAHTLKALGTGIAYLSLWTAYSVYHLLPAGVALLLMLAVTVANSWLAWRQNSILLAGYAMAGGLATPALLWTGGNHELVLFSYLLLLDVAVVTLARLRGWGRLVPAAFAGTATYYGFWWGLAFERGSLVLTEVFVALFFLLFALAPGWLFLAGEGESKRWRPWITYLPVANGLVTFAEGDALLHSAGRGASAGWVSLGIAAVFAALLRVQRRDGVLRRLWEVHAALTVCFLTLAVPLAFDGSTVAVLWLSEALALVWVVRRLPEPVLRYSALGLLGFAAVRTIALPWTDPLRQPVAVLLNAHFATAMVACAVFAAAVWLSTGGQRLSPVGATAGVAFSAVALVAVSVEVHHYWACGGRVGVDLCGGQAGGVHWETYARFTYSAWYMVYGAALMAAGFWRRSAFLRWQALVLLALAVGKVFLFDASGLSSIYRVLSFLGLGVLLLAVSFAYQRDWLSLRQEP